MALPTINSQRLPTTDSQVLNREKIVTFTFDGREYSAYEGDTIASALAAAGETRITSSLKYHRPRGLLCAAGNCPNCLVQVGDEPGVRACMTCVADGMVVEAQNDDPPLDHALMTAMQGGDEILPAGYTYKALVRPRKFWSAYEYILRHSSGFGKAKLDSKPGHFDKQYKHADVTVVGGGPAGLRAALAAAEQGANVILIEQEPALGGHLRYAVHQIEGVPAYQYVAKLAEQVAAHPQIEVMSGTTAFGRYDHNWIGAMKGNRLFKLRTKALVVTTGAYEIPLLFENNDLPGIMLGSAVRRLLHLWGVRLGTPAVVVSANSRGLQTALDMLAAGIELAAIAEMRDTLSRGTLDTDPIAQLQSAGVRILPNTTVAAANETVGRVSSVVLEALDGSASEEIACDLLVLSTGYMPAYELLYQAGTKLVWNDAIKEFTPAALPKGVFAAGESVATHDLAEIEREGAAVGHNAASYAESSLNYASRGVNSPREDALRAAKSTRDDATRGAGAIQSAVQQKPWTATHILPQESRHEFVCLCEDVTRENVRQSVEEGFSSMELLKRYSTISTGPCQGRMCNMAAMQLCAHYNGQAVAETGTTTSRPPARPVMMGVLAGRSMDPVRVTAMHDWHVQHGAKMMNAGHWKRPEHYGDPLAEVRATRSGVGLIDISTLGKFHLNGPEAAALLERIYVNRWQKLGVGRVRYGIMVNDEGVVMDDGVTARLSDDFYYMTATSSGATAVYEWIESFLQTGWQLDVHLLDATEQRVAMNLTGPRARDLLAQVSEGVDLSNAAFPYMNVRDGKVAGVPALLLRVGFTGELGYEIHVPTGYGLHVWQTLMDVGKDFGITPFGVEAQRIMRLEKGHMIVMQDTDGLTNPLEAGMDGLVKLDKDDFVGKTSLVFASQRGIKNRLVGFEMLDGTQPEEGNQIVQPGEGVLGVEILGRITSVRYSPTLDKVIGLCWLPDAMSEPGQEFTVRVHGELNTGRVASLPFYDAEGARLNS